jgi:hypothetical protein
VKRTPTQAKESKGSMSMTQIAQKRFEHENEVIEEELYNFSEAEVDRLFTERPWLKE